MALSPVDDDTIDNASMADPSLTSEDPPTDHAIDHDARQASSCFATTAYVQRVNKTAKVFTQNKPPRPPRTTAPWEGTEG